MKVEQQMLEHSNRTHSMILSELDVTTDLLRPLSSSATAVATFLNSSIPQHLNLSFSDFQTKV